VTPLGLPDRFVEHGSREQLLAECGLDTEGLVEAITAHPGVPGIAPARANR
jgi:1-deoxy-D-xylulose-5-phosphate synthase